MEDGGNLFILEGVGVRIGEQQEVGVISGAKAIGWDLETWEADLLARKSGFEEYWHNVECLAVSAAHGGTGGARDDARSTVRSQLSVINLILSRIAAPHFRVSLFEDDNSVRWTEVMLGRDRTESPWQKNSGRLLPGGIEVLDLGNADTRAAFSETSVVKISDLVAMATNGTATKFQEQLANMWIWLGRAQCSRDSTGAFLFAIIALETGLGLAHEEKIANTLARDAAFLLDDRPKQRVDIYKRIKRWYTLRSKAVHMGKSITGDSEFQHAFRTICKIAARLLDHADAFTKPDQFRIHMEHLTLGLTL